MNCDRVLELLSPHLDGVLVDEERRDLLLHLEECPACREHFESLDSVVSLIRGIPPVSSPEGFREAVVSGLAPRERPRGLFFSLIPVAAAAVLLLSFGALGILHFAGDRLHPSVEVVQGTGSLDRYETEAGVRDDEGLATRDQPAPGVTAPPPAGEPVEMINGARSSRGPLLMDGRAVVVREVFPIEVATEADGDEGFFSEAGRERRLEYVVEGGEPDATVGLILAELNHRRSRLAVGDVSSPSPSGSSAMLERVEADDRGEPARLVLYLTAEEVEYILRLLVRRPEFRQEPADAPKPKDLPPASAPDAAGKTRVPAKPAPPADSGPMAEDETKERKDAEERFRVELRFDR